MLNFPKRTMFVTEDTIDNSSTWRIACECGDPNHDATLNFELDKDGFPRLLLELEVGYYPTMMSSWKTRIKAAFAILFKGHYTFVGDLLLNEDSIMGLQLALTKGVALLKSKKAKI